MADIVFEIALGKLISLAAGEVGLLLGFNEEKEKLESTFRAIKATLQEAEEKQFSNRDIKDWLRKLKEVAYKLDDIMDECAYEALRLEHQGVKCGLSDTVQCSCLSFFDPKHVCFRHKIAKKMKTISERLKQISAERTQLHLTSTVQERTSGDPQERTSGVPAWRQTASSTIEQVYGRGEETRRIVDSLIGDAADASHSENLSVYPIVGQGGLGKTTLAQLIYNDKRVVKYFKPKMWVCVSEDFSWKRMMKAIIKEASGEDCKDSDLQPLQRKLQHSLRAKRYLLVLDDVWDERRNNWETLRSALDCGAEGASILVTTRLQKVADIMRTVPSQELSKLSNNDCWELFKRQAFAPNEVEQVELVKVGKEIVKKCRGLPLAAKALGALLRFETKEEAWLNVLESNIWSLNDDHDIKPALRLSYLKLPVKLRPCFAACALFPKDEIIEKQYLIELWMANGFISSDGRLDVEDVGDEVWNELYLRSFFEDIKRDEFGTVIYFKMHDLYHDLAQSVAEDVCCLTSEKDVTALSNRIHYHLSDHMQSPHSINLHQVKYLRTYIFDVYYNGKHSPRVLKCFSLRVLHWERIKKLSSSIGDLKHLRYLNLSGGHFKTLPESIGKLWNLQILKLDYCQRLRKLPNSLISLKALQQLSLEGCSELSSLPAQMGQMTSLKILSTFIVGKERGCFLGELGPLKLKGGLHIKHLEKVKSVKDAEDALLSSKQLNELTLSWNSDEDTGLEEDIFDVLQPDTQQLQSLTVEGYNGAHIPQWMFALKYLSLRNCAYCVRHPALGKLPSLKKLKIHDMMYVIYVYKECYDGGVVFIALESLTICYLPHLIRLSREDGENMFPRLSKLEISWCDKLNLSGGFQCLTRLEQLKIEQCREVKGLDEALLHMTALKVLELRYISKLESLPDCFGHLPQLQELRICFCKKLRFLPPSLRLSNLQYLYIAGCSRELEKRCEKETGEDWPLIAHIPRFEVISYYEDDSDVQIVDEDEHSDCN